ncbi:tripartite tricarboxylate transporter substrate binding protein [Pigmentiphaga soli]|uniref:Bug family tripartite tricarboxylate transporter substrate binding protein n=1 Tax=Pigmentiphaga soli TaxID=1007095 RepID=UPI0031F04459
MVPFGAGGPTDSSARIVARVLSDRLGQPFVVENKAGGGGTVGPMVVVRAAPDGYTLLWGGTSSLAMGPGLYPKLDYDPVKSFAPIGQVVRAPHLFVGRPSLPAQNLKELVALAKAQPGKLTFGSAGAGSSTHLAGESFKATFGVDLLHIGYKSGAQAVADVIGNQIDLVFDAIPALAPQVQAGSLRAFGVTGTARSPLLPGVPTIAEQLGQPFDAYSWFGLLAPAGTPAPIVQRISSTLTEALADPAVRQQLQSAGFEVLGTSPDAFAKTIGEELTKWTGLIKKLGIAAQ